MACISFFHIDRHSLFKYKHLYAAGGDIAAKEMSMCVAVTKKRLWNAGLKIKESVL